MGSTPPRRIRVAIIGGGIAGLALAAGLTKYHHLDVNVYEAVRAHGDVGAGLALHRNALTAMSLVGPEVRQVYLDKAMSVSDDAQREMATQVVLAHGPHAGQVVAELGRAKGRQSVSRADLLAGLLDLVPRERVHFGKRVEQVWEDEDENKDGGEEEGEVHVRFEDGSQTRADCLLAADGIHSVVRVHLLGADHAAAHPHNRDKWQVYRTLVDMDEARRHVDDKWTRCVPILLGPRGHVNCIPLNKGTRLSAGVAVRCGAGAGAGATLDPSLYADYSPDAQRIVRLVARDTSASWSVGDHDHAPFYARGKVAVMGDAAHAALPFAGNGAAQALEDAAVLHHLFGRVTRGGAQVEAALAAYDAVRRPRSQAVVDLARAFGRVYAYAEDGLHERPDDLRDFFARAAAFTNDADLEKQNDEAMDVYEGLVRGRSSRNGAVDAHDKV